MKIASLKRHHGMQLAEHCILDALSTGNRPRSELNGLATGKVTLNYIALTITALYASGAIYRKRIKCECANGRGSSFLYSLQPFEEEAKPEAQATTRPDLPPLVLNWMGYAA
jgi:hypothetical protein